ncbi:MAG TPA: CYTH domain-containing protein [Candidatus Limnocylindrales bacterium]|jgi:inorganic triphosphatase YgiF
MNEPVEIEVKLSVADPVSLLRELARLPPTRLAGFGREGRLRRVVVTDRYVDSIDGALARVGARARLRSGPGGVVLTVKRRGLEVGGITERVELEGPATAELEPQAWPSSAARAAIIEAVAGGTLVEVVRLRQRRAIRMLRRGDTLVEVSVDQLEALDGDVAIASRWELEAELKAGDRGALAELAGALRRIHGVGPPLGSKRGFALAVADATRGLGAR